MQTHQVIGVKLSPLNLLQPPLLPPFAAETACLAAPVNLDQGLMRYEAELIYVASHDMLAGPDTHLGGGSAGVCL